MTSPTDPQPTDRQPTDRQPTDPEDVKIITLARASRARTQAREGAAVRDTDGRTYTATSVDLAALQLSAVQVAVAMAVSSGAPGLESVAVVRSEAAGADLSEVDQLGAGALDVVRELAHGRPVNVWLAGTDGSVIGVVRA